MAKWKKIITAGPLVMETVYPAKHPRDSAAVRAGKSKLSSEAQQRMNQKYSYQKLELGLAANFVPGDLVVTLTYDDAHLPASRKAADEKLKYFRSKLAAARKKKGQALVMYWNIEHKHESCEGRWHHHCVINSTGDDYELIRKLWGQGSDIEIKPLRVDREKNYETLAKYMAKEDRDKLGQRSWSYTRNARKPEVDTFRVSNAEELTPPRGSTVLMDTGDVQTAYGHYRYIKYLTHGWESTPRPKAKRRRRKASI